MLKAPSIKETIMELQYIDKDYMYKIKIVRTFDILRLALYQIIKEGAKYINR
jgi:hypothetical protein